MCAPCMRYVFYVGIQVSIFCTRNCEYFVGNNSYVGYSPQYIYNFVMLDGGFSSVPTTLCLDS